METGWIKLYRCSIGSRVFNNEGLLKVWIWCLLKANHSTQWVNLKTGKGSIEVECKEGQFIYGRNSAALELKMSPETVRTRMNKLKNIENITIESTKQYSIITIMNWSTYQTNKTDDTSQNTKQTPSKHHANTTNKKDKNEKNDKKDIYGEFKNVKLSAEEHKKLSDKFNGTVQEKIEALSGYMKSKGKTYKDHYATILTWARKESKDSPKQPEYKIL